MTDTNQNSAPTEITEAPRDHNKVSTELKSAVGKLARQEAKATESDKLAATFNDDIMDMATGKVAQTATRTIQTVATEQAKHVKRAAKIRENNTELAGEIRELNKEYSAMISDLLEAYPTDESETEEGDEIENEDEVVDEEEDARDE